MVVFLKDIKRLQTRYYWPMFDFSEIHTIVKNHLSQSEWTLKLCTQIENRPQRRNEYGARKSVSEGEHPGPGSGFNPENRRTSRRRDSEADNDTNWRGKSSSQSQFPISSPPENMKYVDRRPRRTSSPDNWRK